MAMRGDFAALDYYVVRFRAPQRRCLHALRGHGAGPRLEECLLPDLPAVPASGPAATDRAQRVLRTGDRSSRAPSRLGAHPRSEATA